MAKPQRGTKAEPEYRAENDQEDDCASCAPAPIPLRPRPATFQAHSRSPVLDFDNCKPANAGLALLARLIPWSVQSIGEFAMDAHRSAKLRSQLNVRSGR